MTFVPGRIRRVVTGQAPDGRAAISSDGLVPTVFAVENGPALMEVWKTGQAPEPLSYGQEEPAAAFTLHPAPGGSSFRITDIPPDSQIQAGARVGRDLFGKAATADASLAKLEVKAAHMHRTQTIDYGVVLDGEITLLLENGEVTLKTGDVVVQRGANHAWSNRTDKMCRMAFVLIDAKYP